MSLHAGRMVVVVLGVAACGPAETLTPTETVARSDASAVSPVSAVSRDGGAPSDACATGSAQCDANASHVSSPGNPGVWVELSNTAFNHSPAICGKPGAAAAPNCLPSSLPAGGNDQVESAIGAWVSGDYDASRGWLIIPRGGGHADWGGNQVVAFDATIEQWRLVTPTSLAALRMDNTLPNSAYTNPYSDGSPSSVHSYDSVAWMPWIDKMWSSGGIYWSSGQNDGKTFWWDPTVSGLAAWTQKSVRPGGYGTAAVADPIERKIFVRWSGGFSEYDSATDTYSTLFTASGGTSAEMSSMALDPVGRKLYRFNKLLTGFNIRRVDLNNPALKEELLSVAGDTTVQTTAGAGLFWDANRLVAFGHGASSGTGDLYTLDPTDCGTGTLPACQWVRHVPPDGIHPPSGSPQGIWKKWFRHKCDYYLIPNGSSNVWKTRPPWSTDTCP